MQDDSVPFRPGDVVAGRYRVEALLGRGGFGVVYRAVQLNIGRAVALKMLLAEALAHPEGIIRFRREAELAQRLEHPNTVRLYDFGETEQGLPFIAWELLRGRAFDEVIRAEGCLAPGRVARIAAQALKALMEAHALGIVHRDIKPSNVFLCEFSGERDFVKVLDFGIAKCLTDGPGLTSDGVIIGTPNYMPREQVAGHGVTPATDVYALGLVMAEALLGRPVFIGEAGLALCMAQLSDTPVPLPKSVLASPLGSVIARATQKDPSARFATAAEMLAELEASAPQAVGALCADGCARGVRVGAHGAGAGDAAALAPRPGRRAERGSRGRRPTALSRPPRSPPRSPAQRRGPLDPPRSPRPWPRRRRQAGASPNVWAPPVAAALRPAEEARQPAPRRRGGERGHAGSGRRYVLFFSPRTLREGERLLGPSHPAETAHAARGHGGGIGPPVGRRFAQLTPAQLRARIEDGTSYHVGLESSSDVNTYWVLEPRPYSDDNSVMFYRFTDTSLADGYYRTHKGQGGAVARDGNNVLFVKLPQPGAAEALLQRLIR